LEIVLHSFQKDKSPGPNGWTIEFFLGFYDLLKVDLLRVVEESRLSGMIHAPFNFAFLALILKTNDLVSCDDFGLISLCNCIYNIIFKIIF